MDKKTKDDNSTFTPLWGYNIKINKEETKQQVAEEKKEERFASKAKGNNQSNDNYNNINNPSSYEKEKENYETLIIKKIDFLTIPKVSDEQIKKAIAIIDNAFLYLKDIIIKMSGKKIEINSLQTGYKTDLLSTSINPLDNSLFIKTFFINNNPIFLKIDKALLSSLSFYSSNENSTTSNNYSEKYSMFFSAIKELLKESIKEEVSLNDKDEEIKDIFSYKDESCISIPYCFSIDGKEYYLTFVFTLESFLSFIKEERIISFNVSDSYYQNKNAFVSLYEKTINEEVIKELREGSLIKTHFYNNDLLSLYYENRLLCKGDGVKVIKGGQSFYGLRVKERMEHTTDSTPNCFISLGATFIEKEKIRENNVITLDSTYGEGLKLIYNNNVVAIGEMVLEGGFYYFRVTKVLDERIPMR